MKLLVTSDLTHKENEDYQGVLIQFDDEDKHYFHNRKNYMPKTTEAYALHKLMFALDPKYRALIRSDDAELTADVYKLVHALEVALMELASQVQLLEKRLNTSEEVKGA